MNDKLKKFIEDNIDLIEDNKFEELYDKLDQKFGNGYSWYMTGEFTHSCLSAGIDPMPYLIELPSSYLATINHNPTPIDYFRITDNIVKIGSFAFLDCPTIEQVVIPKSVKIIEPTAFGSNPINSLVYEGTMQEFRRIQGDKHELFEEVSFDSVHCSDGDLSIAEFTKSPGQWLRDF